MKEPVTIDVNGDPSLGKSIIRFGTIARQDPDTELHVYQYEDIEPKRVVREFVGGAKSKKYDFPAGRKYIVVVIGDKIAGVASTAPEELRAPFNVHMNPPEDHSKDFMKIPVPANKPIEGDLRRSILATLKPK